VPAPAPSRDGPLAPPAAELSWDVTAVDAGGRILVAWQGVTLREAGLLPRATPWPAALLPAYLEHAAIRLGLDPDLRITASLTEPSPGPVAGSAAVPRPRLAGAAPPAGPPAGSPDSVAGGLALAAGGAPFAACGWALADPQHPVGPGSAAEQAAVFARLRSHLSEPPVASAARLAAAAGCLARAGVPAGAPVTFDRAAGDGWVVLAAAGARLACAVVEVSGLASPVAIAIMTDRPRLDVRRPAPAGSRTDLLVKLLRKQRR
jgi:enediyne polyketide synthase